MDQYYCLNETPGNQIRNAKNKFFPVLDQEAEMNKFITFRDEHIIKVTLFLPDMHCSSCIWLLEHLNKMQDGIIHSAVNFMEKNIYLTLDTTKITLRKTAEFLTTLGYEPQLDQETKVKSHHGLNKKYFIYIGIAGFAFANIMMMSFPEYLGLQSKNEKSIAQYFRYLNLALSLPVLYIAYQAFFVKAYKSIVNKYINIDAPVSLAILVTFIRSVYEIISGTGAGYLDSMSGIVFFMIIGRYFQERTFTTLRFNRNLNAFFPITVEVVHRDRTISTTVQEVKVGEILFVRRGEIIPVDGEVREGNSQIDYSYITGESRPIDIFNGKYVFAGGRLLGDSVYVNVLKSFSQSDFTQMWNNEAFKKEEVEQMNWTDKIGTYFTIVVLFVALMSWMYWLGIDQGKAWNALTAVLIVACPCALLLSSSYTLGFMSRLFARYGLFVKNTGVIDKMASMNSLIFDKTGTLTSDAYQVQLKYATWTEEEKLAAMSLMRQSMHPLSQAILRNEVSALGLPIQSWKEIKGQGIEGWVSDSHVQIGSAEFTGNSTQQHGGSEVFININGKLKAHYSIQSAFKGGALNMLSRLKDYTLTLLSGDTVEMKNDLSKLLPENMPIHLAQSPQDKLNFVKTLQLNGQHVMMIGDGLNDAGALRQSDIGVAVVDHLHSFAPACDVILDAHHVGALDLFLNAARSARNLIKFGFLYAIIYNCIGLYFAVSASLLPIVAAILMPLSSLGVILISFIGAKWICNPLIKMQTND
jgi:Cu+-exporting ATPase